jgi:hypothetical protein
MAGAGLKKTRMGEYTPAVSITGVACPFFAPLAARIQRPLNDPDMAGMIGCAESLLAASNQKIYLEDAAGDALGLHAVDQGSTPPWSAVDSASI